MNFRKKIVVIFLIFSITLGGVYVQAPKASAAGAFGVTILNVQDLLLWIKKVVVRVMARKIMTMLSNQLIEKIRGSGRDGGPAFVRNWRNFITDAQYRGEDIFKVVLASTPVCGYLNKNIKDLFGVTESQKIPFRGNNIRVGDLNPFNLRGACTLPQNFDMNAYRNDFAGNGGWEAWSRLMEPQNNYYGLLFESLNELNKQRSLSEAADLAEATSGGGYTSVRDGCNDAPPVGVGETGPEIQYSNARCKFMGKVFTPGDLLGKSAAATIDNELGWFTNSQEISDIVVGILGAVVDRLGNLAESALLNSESDDSGYTKKDYTEEYCTAKEPSAEAIAYVQQNYPDVSVKFPPTYDCWKVINKDGDGTDDKCGMASYCSTITNEVQDNPYPTQNCISQCLKLTGFGAISLGPTPTETGPPGTIELPVCTKLKKETTPGIYVWGGGCTPVTDATSPDAPNTCLAGNRVLTDNIRDANGCADLKNIKSASCQKALQKICQVAFCAESIQSSNWYGWTPSYGTSTFEDTGQRSRAFSANSVSSFCEKNNFLNLGFSKKNNTVPTVTTICAVDPDNITYNPQLLREPALGILSLGNTYETVNQTSTPDNPLVQCKENNMPLIPR